MTAARSLPVLFLRSCARVVAALTCLAQAAPAQVDSAQVDPRQDGDTPTSLASLEAEHSKAVELATAKAEGALGFAEYTELTKGFCAKLASYLAASPSAPDRVAARLTLVRVQMQTGARKAAKSALVALAADDARPLELLQGAELAQTLGLDDERGAWLEAALAKPAPLAERMEAGMFAMTRLLEVERAQALFAAELDKATDDASRAEVLWYTSAAVREREDREDGDYETALRKIAETYPKTRFGSIASDRLRAMAYDVGAPAVELEGVDVAGAKLSLSALRGKVVLIWYWASWSRRCLRQADAIEGFVKEFGERGFTVLGVTLDDDAQQLRAHLAAHPRPWRSLFDPAGIDGDNARRANIEQVPSILLVDPDGKIAALRLSLFDDESIGMARVAIEAALSR